MKRRQLVVILTSIFVIILILTVIVSKIGPKERYKQKYLECKDIYMEKLYHSYDLSEVEDIAKNAKEAYNKGDYESAMSFLDEAVIALERAKKVTPVMLPVTWTEEEYMEYFIQNFLNRAIPPQTKEQIQLNIDDKSLKQRAVKSLKEAQAHYADMDVETIKLGSLAGEKEKALEVVSTVTNSITRLKEDIKADKDVEVIHASYNMLRSALIQEYQLQQELRRKFESVYDTFIQTYKPKEYHPMKFGVFTSLVSYEYVKKSTPEDIINNINILSGTGVDFIRFDLFLDWFRDNDTETISKIDVGVKEVRSNGKELLIAFYGSRDWGNNPIDLNTYEEWILFQIKDNIPRYKPEYAMVVPEPYGITKPGLREDISPEQWADVIITLADEIKRCSPNTKVIAELNHGGDNNRLFEILISAENEIDIIALSGSGFYLYGFDEMIPLYWDNKDKELWIGETWIDVPGKYLGQSGDKHIIGSVYYAQTRGMTGYSLFFGQRLHTIEFEPTPAFFTYKMVIEEVHNNTIST